MPVDMSAATAPPRRRTTGARKTAEPTPETPVRSEVRRQGLLGIAQGAQLVSIMRGNLADAGAISKYSPQLVNETVILAEQDKYVALGVDTLTRIGPYTPVLMIAIPFALQIMANHGKVNAEALASVQGLDIVPPDVLATQMKAHVAQMQAEAMREQRDAERILRQMEAEQAEWDRQESEEKVPA